MKKVLTIILLNILLVLIQTSFLRELLGDFIAPNLVISFAYALLFMNFEDTSLMSIFIGGLLLDLFGFSIVGLSPLILTGTLILFRYIKKYLFRGWLSNLVLIFLAEAVYSNVILGFSQDFFSSWKVGISTLVFGLLFYFINLKFKDFFGKSGYTFTK